MNDISTIQESALPEHAKAIVESMECEIHEIEMHPDGWIEINASSLPYDPREIFRDRDGINIKSTRMLSIDLPSGQEGDLSEVLDCVVDGSGQRFVLTYSAHQPEYCDDDFYCDGWVKIRLTGDDHAAVLKEAVDTIRKEKVFESMERAQDLLTMAWAKPAEVAEAVGHLLKNLMAGATYELDGNGDIVPNAAMQAYLQASREAEQIRVVSGKSWAGAYLARVLQKYPDLEACRLSFTAYDEYDDQGGTFRSISLTVGDVVFKEGRGEIVLDGEPYDQDVFAEMLQDEIEQSCGYDLYTGLEDVPEWECRDYDANLSRAKLGDLLSQNPVDGLAVCDRIMAEEKAEEGGQ